MNRSDVVAVVYQALLAARRDGAPPDGWQLDFAANRVVNALDTAGLLVRMRTSVADDDEILRRAEIDGSRGPGALA